VVDRFEDIYQFNIEGNFERELENLRSGISKARRGFLDLKSEVEAMGGRFKVSKAAIKEAAAGNEELAKSLAKLNREAPRQQAIATNAKVQAEAFNALAREANRLAVARAAETRALEQQRRSADPRIIQARAETAALKSLTKQLENEAAKRAFRNKAAELGLTVSADGRKLFNLEATAAERVAKAVEKLGIAEATRKGLAAKGLDPAGKPILATDGKLTQAGEEEAQRRAQAALTRKALKDRTDALLGVDTANKKVTTSTNSMRSELLDANQEAEKSDRTFNRISFTFRRLVGILAVFAAARAVANGFKNMISGAIEFNAQLETARVGMAGLIAAAGEVRGPNAQRLGLDEQVLRAQDIAINQMEKLRRDALLTAASYDELSRAFSTAVAPGIQSGLTLDQIRKVTVDISQAATGLGLAQDQLAEEIRALFQGTITLRNTRIATALGISNEDINRAKELGTLFEFLQTRFAAISKTGKLLLNTFTAQLSNASDAFKQLLATSSQPLFEQLKAGLKEVQDAIFSTTQDAVVFDPGVLAAFRGLFEGLAQGVRGIRTAFAQIDIKGFAATLSTIGNVIGTVATALANTFTVFFNIASPTFNILGGIVKLFSDLLISVREATGLFGDLGKGVAGIAAKMGLTFFVFSKIIGSLGRIRGLLVQWLGLQVAIDAATGTVTTSLTGARKGLALLVAGLARLATPLLLIAVAISGLDALLSAFGVNFSLTDKIGDAFTALKEKVFGVSDSVKGLKEELAAPAESGLGSVENDFRALISDLEAVREKAKQTRFDLETSFQISKASQGLPQIPAQIATTRIQLTRDLLNTEEVRKTKQEITNLTALAAKQRQELDKLVARSVDMSPALAATQKEFERLINTKKSELAEVQASLANLKKTDFSADTKRSLRNQEKLLQGDILNLEKSKNNAIDEEVSLNQRAQKLYGEQEATKQRLLGLEEKENALIGDKQIEIAKITKTLADQDQFETSLRIPEQAQALQEAQNAVAAFQTASVVEAAFFDQKAQTAKTLLSTLRQETELQRGLDELGKQKVELEKERTVEAQVAALAVSTQIAKRVEELNLVKQANGKLRERARLEEQLAKLRVSGTTTQGTSFGLETFIKDNQSSFNIGERFGQDLANGVTEFGGRAISESVVAAFDPSRNFNLRESLGNLALQLGQGLLTEVLKQGLASLLQSLGVGLTQTLSGAAAAATPITAAATGVTTAFSTGATVLGSATTAMTSAISAAATAALAAIGAARGAQGASTAASVAGAAGGALATGGRADKARKILFPNLGVTHRNAPGFSVGGRPRGVDSRDTIPAWLRSGEWVIRPEAVRFYGDRLFDMLNRRQLNPDALRLSGGPKTLPSPKVSFATGGRAAASSRSTSRMVVNSVNFFDEQTLDRAFASGPEALTRYSRRRRGGMRAALGIDQAP